MNFLLILLLISIPLGQLTRIVILPGVIVYLQDIVIVLMIINLIKDSLTDKRLFKLNLIKPILIFSVAGLFSLISALFQYKLSEVAIGALYWLRWIAYTSVYFSVVNFRLKKQEIRFIDRKYTLKESLLMSGLAFAVIGLLQYYLFPDLREFKWLGWDDHYFRLTSTLLDPGFTGIILVLTAFLAIESPQVIRVKIISIFISIISLLLTYSRASYLAFTSGITVLFFRTKRLKILLSGVTLFLISLFFLPRTSGEGTNLLRLYSLLHRVENWKQSTVIIRDNPLFGIGFNLLRYSKQRYGFTNRDWQTSHSAAGIDNSYLFVWATTGTFGLLAFLYLLFRFFKLQFRTKKGWKNQSLALVSLTAVTVHALFTNTWFYPWIMIWIWYILADSEVDYSS
jgi:O-antigen ligase